MTECLLGLAVCDSLGCSLEFKKPGTFEPITTILLNKKTLSDS